MVEEGILSLKWNNHISTFIQTLSTLHHQDLYSDVTLACEGKFFSVHKLVLSVCSEYFQEVLTKTKCQHPVIILKDVSQSDLEALLNYMYVGEANVSQTDLSGFIKAAECLKIKGLAIPDEIGPLREKRRYLEQSTISYKRRRTEELPQSQNQRIIKDNDSDSENSRLSDVSKTVQNNSDRTKPVNEFTVHDNDDILNEDGETIRHIPEVFLDDEEVDVKQEVHDPKLEEPDETDEPIENSALDISYTPINLDDTSNSERIQSQDMHHSPHGLLTALPGTSGAHSEGLSSSWESNSTGYNECFSQENSRSHLGIKELDSSTSSFSTSKAYLVSKTSNEYLPSFINRCRPCPFGNCTYIADRESALIKHVRKHTGEKPFVCPFCSHSSSQKSNLSSHIKLRHYARADGRPLSKLIYSRSDTNIFNLCSPKKSA